MNFLAHLLLSYPDPKEMTGNFMGDFVKGKAYLKYPDSIKRGILLHRAIDHFTDENHIVKELVKTLRPIYKRYAAVVSDIVLDHVLAKNFTALTNKDLQVFAEYCYKVLSDNKAYLPVRVAFIVDKIKASQRLQLYATKEGLRNSLDIMSKHTTLPDYGDELMLFLADKESFVKDVFLRFYPELQARVNFERNRLKA